MSDLAMPAVELLDARPGERILDFGCGDGVLTKKLLDSGCDVVGIDSSPDLIRAALRLGLNVSVQNAYEIDFHDEFDAVFLELERRGYDGWAANPWYFPTAQDYGSRLAKAGFRVAYIEIIARPTPLPGDISGFLETFAGSFTSTLPLADRETYIEDVRDRLKPLLCGADGTWTADYTRLRFEAYKTP